MKKFLAVLLVGCFAVSMAACEDKKTEPIEETTGEITLEATTPETTEEAVVTEETIVETVDETDTDASDAEFDASNDTDGGADMMAILTPEEATMIADANETLIMTSEGTIEDLTSFYQEVIDSIEAEGEEVDTDTALELYSDVFNIPEGVGSWVWAGTYDDDNDLLIAVVGVSGQITITVQY